MAEKNTKRMEEIQQSLINHIQNELHDDEDFMFMATMLLKHSMVLYKTFLDDDQIKHMLEYVMETIDDDVYRIEEDDTDVPPDTTVH